MQEVRGSTPLGSTIYPFGSTFRASQRHVCDVMTPVDRALGGAANTFVKVLEQPGTDPFPNCSALLSAARGVGAQICTWTCMPPRPMRV